ncbi:MAG: putative rane protein [Acidimicrobiaceae bacterium]|jgi:putative membrane protein|nr:putative rane protein [Acidimicrobiaceae bacterium]
MFAAVDPWRFHAHPDTWFVVVLSAFAYWYAIRRVGPRLMGAHATVVTRRQVLCFSAGLLAIELASDWPIHDLAENYLFSAHMLQHMLISLFAPPLLLLGMPAWLIRRILRSRWAAGTVRVLCRPLIAGLMFNAVIAISHAPFWVNGTLEHHYLHFWAHLLLFVSALFMWFPVINKLEEFPSLSATGRMVYLFLQSVVPNVPVAFLVMSDGVLYRFYAGVPHPIAGLNAINDQQLAGAIMKVGGTFYLWGIITVLFFRWAAAQYRSGVAADDRAASAAEGEDVLARRRNPRPQPSSVLAGRAAGIAGGTGASDGPGGSGAMPRVLTWDHVAEQLARTPPAEPDG